MFIHRRNCERKKGDDRTRESHAQLDGVRVDVKEKFPNGLMYPGDTEGATRKRTCTE